MNFLSPAVKSRSLVVYPLELGLLSSNMKKSAPLLAKEVVTASSTVNGNLASLLADFKQRKINTENRLMGILAMIREKYKYSSYIAQMEKKCEMKSGQIFITPVDSSFDAYFANAYSNEEKRQSLTSSHKYFSNLEDDDHPQYLLKTGGEISGDIVMTDNSTIGGIHIPTHSHDGSDGSVKIKASSIDYSQDRSEVSEVSSEKILIDVDSFSQKITLAGDPLIDMTVSVKLDENLNLDDDRYEIRITYTELEKQETL